MVMTEAMLPPPPVLRPPAEAGADLGEKILSLMRSNDIEAKVRDFIDGNEAHREMRRAFLEALGRSMLFEPVSDDPVIVLSINGYALVQTRLMGTTIAAPEVETPYGVEYFFWPYDGPDVTGVIEFTEAE